MSRDVQLKRSTRMWCGIGKWTTLACASILTIVFFAFGGIDQATTHLWSMLPTASREVIAFSSVKDAAFRAVASLSVISLLAIGWAVFWMFHILQTGSPLSNRSAVALWRLGAVTVVAAALDLIRPSLSALVLTFDNPAGLKTFVVSVQGGTLALMVVGIVVMCVGHVMAQAARMADEHRQFV